MNQTKKAFRLIGAIGTIVISALMIIGGVTILSVLSSGDLSAALSESGLDLGELNDAAISLLKTSTTFLVIFSVVALVFAILLCANKIPKGSAITLIVLMSILSLLEFAGASPLYGFICLVVVVMLIVYLAVKENRQEMPNNYYNAAPGNYNTNPGGENSYNQYFAPQQPQNPQQPENMQQQQQQPPQELKPEKPDSDDMFE